MMSARIISFPRQATILHTLKAAQDEVEIVLMQEQDSETAAELLRVIEVLEEIIRKISGL